MLKRLLFTLFQKIGVKVVKHPESGFEYLLSRDRHEPTNITLLGKPFEISDGHSFYYSHREIFIDEIYQFHSNKESPTIIDCGSNYGTSIVYFKNQYPKARIIGVEADPHIFDILNRNICNRELNEVTLINKAMSNQTGPIQFFSNGADGGRIHTMTENIGAHTVKSLLLDEIINGEVDFLKMDIEGSESDVICHSNKLKKVNEIFIEYHSFLDCDQRLGDLLSCLTENGFRYYIHTQYCCNKPFMKIESQLGMDLQLNIFAKRY